MNILSVPKTRGRGAGCGVRGQQKPKKNNDKAAQIKRKTKENS